MKTLFLLARNLKAVQRLADCNWWRIMILWLAAMLVRYGLLSLAIAGFVTQLPAQTNQPAGRPFINGEVLRYKVKWAFVRLGTVTIRQERVDSNRYSVEMMVQSAPALPFMSVHFWNRTYLTDSSQAVSEETILSGKDMGQKTVYSFDCATGNVIMEDSLGGKEIKRDSLKWDHACYDALGLLMYSRRFAGSGLACTLPTLNDYKINPTDLIFRTDRETVDVDAFDAARECFVVSGNARWVGTSFAGMKGPIRGWITADESAIPLKARVEILLGSIVLELESYDVPRAGPSSQIANAAIN